MPTWTSIILISSLLTLGPSLLGAETQAFFSSQESVEREMTRLIENSRSGIDIALFELKSPSLVVALKRAEGRGVKLRLVLDASHREEDLSAGNVRWIGGKQTGGRGVMHNKFVLFDGTRVVTGSYNWTPGAEHSNYENALLTDDEEAVKSYQHEFDLLWDRASLSPHASAWKMTPISSGIRRHPPSRPRKKASRQRLSKSGRIRVLRSVPPKL